ncbi:MAG: DUF2207 domain-containing protein [bacterium]|nr:DUF2207 domain-containing protein [bacterium]
MNVFIALLLSWYIKEFNVALRLTGDNLLDVNETITVDFENEKRHGIYRNIPVKFRNDQLSIKVISAGSYDFEEMPWVLKRGPDYLTIRIGDPDKYVSGVVRYYINYQTEYAVFDSLNYQYFIWNVTGNSWNVPIDSVICNIALPVLPLEARAYTGFFGARGKDAKIYADSIQGYLSFATTRALEPYEGLTILLKFPPNTFKVQSKISKLGKLFLKLWPLFIPFIAFFILFLEWYKRGRDPYTGTIVVQYQPPEDLTPSESGTIFDEKVDPRDITAEIVFLMLNGYIQIEEGDKKEIIIKKLKDCDENLKPHQCAILKSLFKPEYAKEDNKVVKISDLKNRYYKEFKKISREIYKSLTTRGYFREEPETVRASYYAIGVGISMGIGIVGQLLMKNSTSNLFIIIFSAILNFLIFSFFGRIMVAKTEKGAQALRYLRGLREFIHTVEKERLKLFALDNPEMFKRLLPYAIAFGEEEKWGKVFDEIFEEIKERVEFGYVRVHSFVPTMTYLNSTLYSIPHSSGGSHGGFSGGFSGGGAGGGGGGAW